MQKKQNISGKIQGAYRVGGRILIVAGIAADAYSIYKADDKLKQTAKVAGGWAGAGAAMAAYNSVTWASNATGPWAWGANVVGNIVVGATGYWGGSEAAEWAYEVTVEKSYTVK